MESNSVFFQMQSSLASLGQQRFAEYTRNLVAVCNAGKQKYEELLVSAVTSVHDDTKMKIRNFFLFGFLVVVLLFSKEVPTENFVKPLEELRTAIEKHRKRDQRKVKTSLLVAAVLCLAAFVFLHDLAGENRKDNICDKKQHANSLLSRVYKKLSHSVTLSPLLASFKMNNLDKLDSSTCSLLKMFARLVKDDLHVDLTTFKEAISIYFDQS